jgi:hypothetical protein
VGAVVPAWEIRKLLLEHPDLVKQRKKTEDEDEAKVPRVIPIDTSCADHVDTLTPTADLLEKLFQRSAGRSPRGTS